MVDRIIRAITSRLGLALLLIGASAVPSAASAELLFTITGGATASFIVDPSPTPTAVTANYFQLYPLSGTFQGSPDSSMLAEFDDDGGFDLLGSTGTIVSFGIPGMFSGPLASPTFNTGIYGSIGLFQGIPIDFTVTISDASAAVPEPSTWMMLVAGFGMIGGAIRYGRRKAPGFATA
jgi:hypothetical protein